MAESIVYNISEKILVQLGSLIGEQISLAWGLRSDLQRLWTSVSSINAVLSDAEEQGPANAKIRVWLRQLRDLLYDAEDVLDEFSYEVLRREVVGGKVGRFFSSSNPIAYRLRIGHKIKNIRDRLGEIKANKDEFNLNQTSGDCHVWRREREITDSLINATDLFGREEDRESIVKFLMLSADHNVSVVPIIGIGGMGKTVVAKMVYNDQRIVRHFDTKAWVCLGDKKEFHVHHTFSKIVQFITGRTSVYDDDCKLKETVIEQHFKDKRFLLVLDDIWSIDRNSWLEFKGLLASGAEGSRILVTTRSSSVANCVDGTICAYSLEGLPHNECVSLFKKLAFSSEAEVDGNLMAIGEEIVRKCKGVPLAVRCVGGLLFSRSDRREWISLRDSNIWQTVESIIPILKYSYDHLPCHMKQCFLYCSFFPEDYVFEENSLISFWMAHGLLKSSKKVLVDQPEYVGKQCINEFLSIGFFQDFHQVSTWESKFTMHDLVAELAHSLTQNELEAIDANHKIYSENDTRHVWLEKQSCPSNTNNRIRSVVVPNGSTVSFYKDLFSSFRNLRFLRICNSELQEFPNCIGTLKLLRSLELLECRRLKELPNSICKLHNLLTLSLYGCEGLEELPAGMGELVNLRWLCVTTRQRFLPENGIESLTCLQFLWFWKCPGLETLFQGTQMQLRSLRTLIVFGCHSLVSLSRSAVFPPLEVLDVEYCRDLNLAHFLDMSKLVSLKITYLQDLNSLPDWIQKCASTLMYLEIQECNKLRALPEWLTNLTSLRTLRIECCSALMSLPQGIQRLTALKEFQIKRCDELGQRCRIGGAEWFKIAHVPNVQIR